MNTTLSLPISKEMVEAIDKWRGQQPGVPSRSEAIRQMVQHALDSGFSIGPAKFLYGRPVDLGDPAFVAFLQSLPPGALSEIEGEIGERLRAAARGGADGE